MTEERYNQQIINNLGGSGDINPAVKTAAATLALYERTVLADSTAGAFAITLPAVAEARGLIYAITQIVDNGNVTVQDQDDSYGWADMVLTAVADHVLLYSDGRVWHQLVDVTT